jgi:hypothetical protein
MRRVRGVAVDRGRRRFGGWRGRCGGGCGGPARVLGLVFADRLDDNGVHFVVVDRRPAVEALVVAADGLAFW